MLRIVDKHIHLEQIVKWSFRKTFFSDFDQLFPNTALNTNGRNYRKTSNFSRLPNVSYAFLRHFQSAGFPGRLWLFELFGRIISRFCPHLVWFNFFLNYTFLKDVHFFWLFRYFIICRFPIVSKGMTSIQLPIVTLLCLSYSIPRRFVLHCQETMYNVRKHSNNLLVC